MMFILSINKTIADDFVIRSQYAYERYFYARI